METKPISYYLAPALLLLGAVLAGANWYLDPLRAVASMVALVVIACMTVVLLVVARPARQEGRQRQEQDSVRNGIVFAGLMVVVSLGAKLFARLIVVVPLGGNLSASPRAVPGDEFSQRALMVILGAFLVFTGNAIPKTLTRLSVLSCDAGRAQAFQRFAGWTWVLAGLAFTVAWLALPMRVAELVTMLLFPSVMILLLAQILRLRRTRQRAA